MTAILGGIDRLQQGFEALEAARADQEKVASQVNRKESELKGLRQLAVEEVRGSSRLTELEKIGWTYALNLDQGDLIERAEGAVDRLKVLDRELSRPDTPFILPYQVISEPVVGFKFAKSSGDGIGPLHSSKVTVGVERQSQAQYKIPTNFLLNCARIGKDEVGKIDLSRSNDYKANMVIGTEGIVRFAEILLERYPDSSIVHQILLEGKDAGFHIEEDSEILTRLVEEWRVTVVSRLGKKAVTNLRNDTSATANLEDVVGIEYRDGLLGITEEMVIEAARQHNDESHQYVEGVLGSKLPA